MRGRCAARSRKRARQAHFSSTATTPAVWAYTTPVTQVTRAGRRRHSPPTAEGDLLPASLAADSSDSRERSGEDGRRTVRRPSAPETSRAPPNQALTFAYARGLLLLRAL